jgi:hypothetical protein
MEISPGDIVHLKKKHPCGNYEWQVLRVGSDIGIKCTGCQRRVLMKRSDFERLVKKSISGLKMRPGQNNTYLGSG